MSFSTMCIKLGLGVVNLNLAIILPSAFNLNIILTHTLTQAAFARGFPLHYIVSWQRSVLHVLESL